MSIVRHDLKATCPPEKVWALLSDLVAVPSYNSQVRAVRLRGGQVQGIGAERECDLAPKGKVVERVTVWEDGRALGLEVVESDWPIRHMRWVTRVAPDTGGTRVTQELDYQVKFGPLGWALDQLIMKRMLERNVGRALMGMIERAEGAA
jgi:ligand-binding SRPBCC domain-containing protein